jgi:hypothetical protein
MRAWRHAVRERGLPDRRRRGAAWLVSLALHALLAALLVLARRAHRPPPPLVEPAPLAVEMEIAPAAPPGEPPAEPPREPEARPPARPRPARPTNPERLERAERETPTAPPPAPQPGPAPTPTAPPARPGSPDLSIGALAPEARSRLGVGPGAPAVTEAKPHKRPSVDEMRAALEHAEDAVANVERGRVDPVLYDYLRGARTRFESEARRLAENIPVGGGDAVHGWTRGYLQRVDEVHRAAAASAHAGEPAALDPPDSHPDLFRAYGENRAQADAGAEERRVEVCLEVRAGGGSTPEAVLQRPSGNAALDRLALDSFGRAVAARPPSDDKRRARACYEVTIRAYRIPPLPVVGCSFDLTSLTGISCYWPFKKIASVRARLLSVDYAPDGAPQASRSLLRAPR